MYKLIAHRGASAQVPENTLLAVRVAMELGADVIELDIQLTKDNVPIAFHDEDLENTYGIKRDIHTQTYDQLKEIAPHLFSTLDEIYALDPPPIMLDIKTKKDPEPILKKSRPQDLYFAFDDELAKRLPQNRMIGLYGRDNLPLLSINHELVKPNMPGQLWAWTVDNPKRAQELIDWGIAGLITNNLVLLKT